MSVIPVRKAPTPGHSTTPSDNAAVARSPAVTAASIANRQAMPQVAAAIDQLRAVFGTDQVQVIYACENGRELGREPPPGVIAYPPHVPCKSRVNRPDGGKEHTPAARTSHRVTTMVKR